MTATPITPVLPAAPDTTTTRIEQPTTLFMLRGAWVALLVFQLVCIAYLIPLNLTANGLNEASRAALQQLGSSLMTAYNITYTLIASVNALVAFLIAWLLMWRSRNERVAVLFAFTCLMLMTGGYVYQAGTLPVIVARAKGLFSILALLPILYLFPDARFTPRWTRYVCLAVIAVMGVNYLQYDLWTDSASLAGYTAFLVGAGSFIYRYRHASPTRRQQIKWMVPVVAALPVIILLWMISFFLLPAPLNLHAGNFLALVSQSLFIALELSIGLAVLRYNLWQVDLVINRTLVYSGLALVVALIFIGLIALTSAMLGSQGTVVGLAFGAGITFGIFHPVRHRMQHMVDLRLYNLRYDLNEVAAAQHRPDISNPGAFTGRQFGNYEALGVLGRGGMGEVYKGFGSGETVAIKLLPGDLARQEEFRKRFEREAKLLGALKHPNIVQLRDSGVSDGTYYLAMEFIDGQELSQVILRGAMTDYDSLREWVRAIASALDNIHAQGLVHRDLKPSNIMMRNPARASGSGDMEQLQPVLMDFGIARSTATGTRLTGTGAVGTIDYMAPEQIMAARDVDKRADIYALGVIVYELLTGERPFKGSAGQVLFAHLQQPAPDPCELNVNVPPDIAKAVQQALAKQPDERYQSAGEFAEAI